MGKGLGVCSVGGGAAGVTGRLCVYGWFWHPTGGPTLRAEEELVLEGGCEKHCQVLMTYQSDQVCQSFQSLQSSQAVCRSGALDPH